MQSKPVVLVVLFLNKAYQNRTEKLALFKTIENAYVKFIALHINSMVITWSPRAPLWQNEHRMIIRNISFAAEPKMFDMRSRSIPWEARHCDLFIRWDDNPEKYQLRREINKLVHDSHWIETGINVSYSESFISDGAYKKRMARCKMHISTIGMPTEVDLVGTRYFEVLASGTSLLLAQRQPQGSYAYEGLGLVDGVNFVAFSNTTELVDKLQYFKENQHDAYGIIERARTWSLRNDWSARANTVIQYFEAEFSSMECMRSGR